MSIVAVILSAVLTLWGIVIFNLLVRDRNRVAAAWSDVDVQLKRRHDLIPKLVEAVKQNAGYERGVL
ncbi:MAG: LemA family protein, partial [Nitrososphaera sp.]|nr:LemA family protein [Nitrososphaera sp.]